MDNFEGKRVINGTFGYVWLDAEQMSECTKLNAKVSLKKTAVPICGKLADDHKITGVEQKGSMKLQKISSKMTKKIGEAIKQGKTPSFTIISKLADPDSLGTERIALYGVTFEEINLIDWERKKMAEETINFTFLDFEFLETI